MASFLFFLIIVLTVVGTVVVIVAVRQANRYFGAVTQATCVSCGAVFGELTEKQMKRDFDEALKKVLYENPGWLVSSTQEWPVECPICGTRHKYRLDGEEVSAKEVDAQGQ